MSARKRPTSGPTDKMTAYRERLRRQGLRPVQIWVPDTEAAGFAQSLAAQVGHLNATDERTALAFIEHVAEDA